MLNRLFVVDSVTLTSTGTAVSSYTPWDQTTRKLPTQVVVKATGQGAYVRLSNDASAATNADVLVQGGDHVVLSVQGRRWVSVLSDGASSTVNVGALSTGVSGSAASLDLAFVDAGVLDPRVTFTRASTATYFNSAGVLTSAAINESRRDFDPATLAVRGLLIEEQRTNLTTRSEEFNDAAWTKTNSSITANATTAPSGTATADKLIEALDTNLVHQTTQSATIVSLTTYTASVFVKADTRTRVRVGFLVGASGVIADANLTAGTIGAASAFGGGAAVASSIQAINNGWYRISVVGAGAAGTSGEIRVELLDASGNRQYNGDGTSGLFIWGAQLEAGAFPTSYIPTTTTALTRSQDRAVVSTLSPWFNATTGTIYAEFAVTQPASGGNQFLARFSDNGYNNSIAGNIDSGGFAALVTASGGVFDGNASTSPAVSANTVNKFAGAYAANDLAASRNGGTVATDNTATIPSGLIRLDLGSDHAGFNNIKAGYLRRVTYYPRKFSNAELQAITA